MSYINETSSTFLPTANAGLCYWEECTKRAPPVKVWTYFKATDSWVIQSPGTIQPKISTTKMANFEFNQSIEKNQTNNIVAVAG